jgi:hypothetical protein
MRKLAMLTEARAEMLEAARFYEKQQKCWARDSLLLFRMLSPELK